ncbi:MAG: trans-2-enoyl-CoA reductase family protein [Amoebophilaceae bacterium]|nr:trans-2-enoyl-CoA reductase family protein [Amoebophilaceae bacterium]
MLIQSKVRGFICTTAHPSGCAQHVLEQIQYVKSQPAITGGPKKVLIIGGSTGYGLASRIVTAFGAQAQTIGVFFERPAQGNRTASPGWYNTAAFEKEAAAAGLYAKSINGDGFSDEIKQQTLELIEKDWGGGVDLLIYSLASPRRIHPQTGVLFQSVLKPIGEQPYTNKTIDVTTGAVSTVTIETATAKEIEDTVAVMGGEDWMMWIDALREKNLLADGIQTLAYSYIGPKLTDPIYTKGTIGQAKKHLAATSKLIQEKLKPMGGNAYVAINKALVTQASAAIPVVPLYISLIYKIMKAQGIHEGCIEQMYRLYKHCLYRTDQKVALDASGLIRIDDWELAEAVQKEVEVLWEQVDSANVEQRTDLAGYRHDFYKLFGFEVAGIDYTKDSVIEVAIPSING